MLAEFEINKDLLKKVISSHKKFAETVDSQLLQCFHFELIQNVLKISSTDGNRALQSTIEVKNVLKNNCAFNISAEFMKGLTIIRGTTPNVTVIIDNNCITFDDKAVGITQQYILTSGSFPNVEKLLKKHDNKEENYVIKLNKTFFKDLENLLGDRQSPYIDLNINKKDRLKPIVIKNINYDIKQTALLMPVQVAE